MVHKTTCGIIRYYHSIGFMLCCSITHPSLYLTIPQGSKCISNTHSEQYTLQSQSLFEICSIRCLGKDVALSRICLFLLPFSTHSSPSMPKQISCSIIVILPHCVFTPSHLFHLIIEVQNKSVLEYFFEEKYVIFLGKVVACLAK